MIVHYAIRVIGRVQGVFFRASTHEKASALQLKGFVRNEPDGAVYIEAEGEKEVVEKLIDWCRSGPARARVDRIDATEGDVVGFKEFSIRR